MGIAPCCYREQLGYALYATFREPRLYRMAVTGDWEGIPARCKSHPKEAAFVHKYPPADTALHRIVNASSLTTLASSIVVCENDSHGTLDEPVPMAMNQETVDQFIALKMAAIRALLEANRQAASLTDTFGRTPLHLACMDVTDGGAAAALEILSANPMAATVTDVNEQRTPLHFLVARNAHVPLDLLTALVQKCDTTIVQRRDICGESPLDIVERRMNEIDNAAKVLDILRQVPCLSSPQVTEQNRTTRVSSRSTSISSSP
jgi:hypothetical protein